MCTVMFIGQTNSGKTMMVRSIANYLGYNVDEKAESEQTMTQYEIHDVAGVTGSSITIVDFPCFGDTAVTNLPEFPTSHNISPSTLGAGRYGLGDILS